jgi:hypothetical protein
MSETPALYDELAEWVAAAAELRAIAGDDGRAARDARRLVGFAFLPRLPAGRSTCAASATSAACSRGRDGSSCWIGQGSRRACARSAMRSRGSEV